MRNINVEHSNIQPGGIYLPAKVPHHITAAEARELAEKMLALVEIPETPKKAKPKQQGWTLEEWQKYRDEIGDQANALNELVHKLERTKDEVTAVDLDLGHTRGALRSQQYALWQLFKSLQHATFIKEEIQ